MANQLYLVFAIHRMTHEIAMAVERANFGVNQPEAHILAHLAENGASTVAAIHRAFGHKRSTLTSILDRLESRQLIERTINAADRRSFLLKLTESGESIAREVHKWLHSLEAKIASQLTTEQLAAFDAFCGAVGHATQAG